MNVFTVLLCAQCSGAHYVFVSRFPIRLQGFMFQISDQYSSPQLQQQWSLWISGQDILIVINLSTKIVDYNMSYDNFFYVQKRTLYLPFSTHARQTPRTSTWVASISPKEPTKSGSRILSRSLLKKSRVNPHCPQTK